MLAKRLIGRTFLTNDYAMPSSIDFVLSDWAQVNKLRWKSDNEDNPKYSGSFEIKDPYLNTENDVFTLPLRDAIQIEAWPKFLSMNQERLLITSN